MDEEIVLWLLEIERIERIRFRRDTCRLVPLREVVSRLASGLACQTKGQLVIALDRFSARRGVSKTNLVGALIVLEVIVDSLVLQPSSHEVERALVVLQDVLTLLVRAG